MGKADDTGQWHPSEGQWSRTGRRLLGGPNVADEERPGLTELLDRVRGLAPPYREAGSALLNEEAVVQLLISAPDRALDEFTREFCRKTSLPPERVSLFVKECRKKYGGTAPEAPSSALLADLMDVFTRYIALPAEAPIVVALWVMHTWVYERFTYTPRLVITSPTAQCGKTRLLELLEALCFNAQMTANITPAALFRQTHDGPGTLLVDEADTFLRRDKDLHGVINAGYSSRGFVTRVVRGAPVRFQCFAPTAIAAINLLPGTIMDRAVTLHMVRKPVDVRLAAVDAGARGELDRLNERLSAWSGTCGVHDGCQIPRTSDTLSDRQADIVRPLLAIAASAGTQMAEAAWQAVHAVFDAARDDAMDVGVQLLAGVRSVFAGERDPEFMTLKDIVVRLRADDDATWSRVPPLNRPLDTALLSRLLQPFGIKSFQSRKGAKDRARGYSLDQIAGVAAVYCGAPDDVADE